MIIPAIDLIDGHVVRLYQGDYNQKTQYQLDPIDVVHQYADAGAKWLHIVDLTGAKDVDKRQLGLIKRMVDTGRMSFQSGGGIRSEADVSGLLDIGVKRVVIGSLAVKQPELVKSWITTYEPEAIVLALDVNINAQGQKCIATHGWQEDSGVEIEGLLEDMLSVGATRALHRYQSRWYLTRCKCRTLRSNESPIPIRCMASLWRYWFIRRHRTIEADFS